MGSIRAARLCANKDRTKPSLKISHWKDQVANGHMTKDIDDAVQASTKQGAPLLRPTHTLPQPRTSTKSQDTHTGFPWPESQWLSPRLKQQEQPKTGGQAGAGGPIQADRAVFKGKRKSIPEYGKYT